MNTKLKEMFFEIFGSRDNYSNNDNDIRTERIYIRLTKQEKELLQAMSKSHKSNSDFVRYILFKKYIDDFIKVN
jgi:hypothetical protein